MSAGLPAGSGPWRSLRSAVRPADGAVLLAAGALLIALYAGLWGGDARPAQVLISVDGREFARLSLFENRRLDVPGPAGITVVEVRDGRARCVASPGPQHLCERAGWLARGGDSAVGLPNRVSIEILDRDRRFDSLTY